MMWKSRKFKQLFLWRVLSCGTQDCHYTPNDRNLHNHRFENLKSHILSLYLKRLFWTYCPGSLKHLYFENWFYFHLQMNRIQQNSTETYLSHSVHLKTEREPIKTQWFEQSQTMDKVQNNRFKQCVTPLSKCLRLIFFFLVNIILLFKAIY
jgi:hypothetical protein